MPEMDFSSAAGIVSTLAGVFGAGWGACHLYIVAPMRLRLEKLEAKLDRIETGKDEELARLREIILQQAGG